MEDRTYPRFWIFLDFLIPTVILAVATVLLRIFPWDMQIERHFYLPGSGWIIHKQGRSLLFQQRHHVDGDAEGSEHVCGELQHAP